MMISTTPKRRLRRKTAATPTTIRMMPTTHTIGTAPPLKTEASRDATNVLCVGFSYLMCRLTPTGISGQSTTASSAESTAVRLFRCTN
jgi:hypothetical protein